MPKSENQKLKMFYVLKMLSEQTDEEHGISLKKLIDGLEAVGITAERKSLYSDIRCLTEFGCDIQKKKINGETIYCMGSRDFQLPELKLLVDAVQSSKFITQRKSRELIKKLEKLASVHEAKQLNRTVYVANRVKTMNEHIYYTVDTLHSAIALNRQIIFNYCEWGMDKKLKLKKSGGNYTVSPWQLTWADENYYLVAYDSENGQIRHYRVDKMKNVTLSGEKRDGAEEFKNFDLGSYLKKTFGMFSGKEETVTLRCENSLIGVIIDRFGTEVTTIPADEGHFDAVIHVSVSPHFFGWVSCFGTQVKIISPEHTAKEYAESLRSISALYE